MDALTRARADPRISWYRQRVAQPKGLLGVIAIAVLTYLFSGFFVYWRITGSGTIGKGGTVTALGSWVWFGPLLIAGAIFVIGPRGPLARLYGPRVEVGVDHDHLWWIRGEAIGEIAWEEVLGINRAPDSVNAGDALAIWDLQGRLATGLPEQLSRIGRRGRTTLQQLAVATRPDLFARSGGFWTQAVAIRKDLPEEE